MGIPMDRACAAVIGATGAIGDRVWLDEDGDGVQDAGETGIPNVEVQLSGTDALGNAVSLTTTTDANGNYLFPDVPVGDYTVTYNVSDAAGNAADRKSVV